MEFQKEAWPGLTTEPCRCDPPGSGEEFCTGACEEPQSVEDQLHGKLADVEYRFGMLYQNLRRLVDNLAFCPKCAEIISRQVLTPKETP